MKRKLINNGCWALVLSLLVISCKKSEYLTDEGVHNAATPLSNYDYLKQHGWNSFDTLIAIIDHFNLKEEVNSAPTIFAPTNYSISRYVKLLKDAGDPNRVFNLDSLYNRISADSVRQYLLGDKVTLGGSVTGIKPYTSKANTSIAVQKFLQTSTTYYQWASTPVYSLYYIKVRGSIDDPANPLPATDPSADTRVICQTTGILTSNGNTVLHVLDNQHIFVRF